MTRHGTRHSETPTTPVKLIIAARLRDAQTEKGFTNEELAQESGISLRLVQRHRAGENVPGDENLRRYADALDKPLAYFFTGEPLELKPKKVAA